MKRLLCLLVLPDAVDVSIEEVARVERASLGLGVELSAEDGAVLVDHSFVGRVVEVDEVLLELGWDGGGIDGVSVVLRSDVAFASHEIQSGDVVGAVTVFHLGSAGTDGNGKKLVAQTDTHDGDLRSRHELGEVVAGGTAVGWVTGTVGDEDTVKVVGNLVDGVIVRQAGDRGSTGDERAQDVLLDTTVDQGDVHVAAGRRNVPWCLGADLLDQVDAGRVLKGLVLIGIVFLTDDNFAEG